MRPDTLLETIGELVSRAHDVNAVALGEWRYGLARGAASLVVLALGTGLGGAVILDGRLVRGRSGYGEFGHVPVKFDGRSDNSLGQGAVHSEPGRALPGMPLVRSGGPGPLQMRGA